MSESETQTASETVQENRPASPAAEEPVTREVIPPPPREERREVEEEEVFEDASDAGEVFVRRRENPRPHHYHPVDYNPPPPPVHNLVSTPSLKPEDYDGTTDWAEYQIYFDQLAELYGWDDEKRAMILGICLRGEARVVLAGLDAAQRRSYFALTTALAQSFAPKELIHLHQAELKARRKKPDESMVDLGRDVARLVRLAYPTADVATREVIGINTFLESLPGPATEMRLHVIKGRPRSLQEAVAHATEVDAVIEADNRKTSRKRGDVRMVRSSEEESVPETMGVEKLKKELEKTQNELKEVQMRFLNNEDQKRNEEQKRRRRRPLTEVTCYGCGEKGHYKKTCPKNTEQTNQGNESRRLSH